MDTSPFDIAQDGNLFPREDLLDAVAESDWRDRGVPPAAWVLTAAGVAILAAGLPVARLIVPGSVEFAATGPSLLVHPIHALAAFIGGTGIGIEAAFFLLSALGLGLCLPAVGLALRAAGFGRRLAFVASLVAVSSPLLLLCGRLPVDAPFAVLGAALALASVSAPFDDGPAGERGYTLRLVVALVVAHLLHPSAGLLVVPMIVAVHTRTTRHKALRCAALIAVTAAFLVSGQWGATGETGATAVFGRGLDLLAAGGVAWLLVPLAWKKESEEAPPPPWLMAWLVAVSVSALGLAVVPALAVFTANHLARSARPDRALRWALGLMLGQIALAWVLAALAPVSTTSFAATGSGETRPTDTVMVTDESSTVAYLLRRRLGLTVRVHDPARPADPAPRGAQAPTGRRLTLDQGRVPAPYSLDPETGRVTPRE